MNDVEIWFGGYNFLSVILYKFVVAIVDSFINECSKRMFILTFINLLICD